MRLISNPHTYADNSFTFDYIIAPIGLDYGFKCNHKELPKYWSKMLHILKGTGEFTCYLYNKGIPIRIVYITPCGNHHLVTVKYDSKTKRYHYRR